MFAWLAATAIFTSPQTFTATGTQFRLNGAVYQIRSGEMHYPRVPRAYWRDRMQKAKAMGLNTICTYVFWNLHEPTPGRFDFRDNLDLAAYLQAAKDAGLKVIIRPGPYICTETDFGGFPSWLLADRRVKVRSRDPKYLGAVERYMMQVGKVIQPYLLKNGGPVIMAQVENEYGSYGDDHVYMAWVRDTMIKAGFDCLLCTSDGPGQGMLNGGTLPGITPAVNFGGGAEGAFKELEKFRPGTPRMIGEYWCGWFDHWGNRHATTGAQGHVNDIEWCMKNGVSFNLYMFHGGTNFGYMQGANGGSNDFGVDTTSYDYDSPLSESGQITPKYWAFRAAIQKYVKPEFEKPKPAIPSVAVGPITLKESVPMLANLPRPVESAGPMSFEELGQPYGSVLYEFSATQAGKLTFSVERPGDYATFIVDGKEVGTIDRRLNQKTIELNIPKVGAPVRVLVESLSRINFGHMLPNERKGLEGAVTLGGELIYGWKQYPLSMVPPKQWKAPSAVGPRYYRGKFDVPKVGDTHLDMRAWGKGFVWVNGHNLGRFWSIGPQQTLYLPGSWLRRKGNEIVVLSDQPHVYSGTILGLREPLLDVVPSARVVRATRTADQNVVLKGLTPAGVFTLPRGPKAAVVSLSGSPKGRYLAIEALSEQGTGFYTTLAEINATGADGKALARDKWKVVYADSEELQQEDGSALNVIDNQPTTIWHTEYGATQPKHPHILVIDLGEEVSISSLSLLPRQEGSNGWIKDLRVYLSAKPFPGQ